MQPKHLNAQAKASAKRQHIVKLDDPRTQNRAWLKDVVKKARLIGAEQTVTNDWVARDQINLTTSSHAQASTTTSPLLPGTESKTGSPTKVKQENGTQSAPLGQVTPPSTPISGPVTPGDPVELYLKNMAQ